MKVEIINEERDYFLFKESILYEDDSFYIYSPLIWNNIIQVIPRKEEKYRKIEELPEYIRDIILKEVM